MRSPEINGLGPPCGEGPRTWLAPDAAPDPQSAVEVAAVPLVRPRFSSSGPICGS